MLTPDSQTSASDRRMKGVSAPCGKVAGRVAVNPGTNLRLAITHPGHRPEIGHILQTLSHVGPISLPRPILRAWHRFVLLVGSVLVGPLKPHVEALPRPVHQHRFSFQDNIPQGHPHALAEALILKVIWIPARLWASTRSLRCLPYALQPTSPQCIPSGTGSGPPAPLSRPRNSLLMGPSLSPNRGRRGTPAPAAGTPRGRPWHAAATAETTAK